MDTSYEPSPDVQAMMQAALKAAHVALYRRREGLKVAQKVDDGHDSNVTNGDTQSEQVIKEELKRAFSGRSFRFITEETAADASSRASGWHVVADPIDGTTGYSLKTPEGAPWAVSIALEKDGKTVAAAVYEAHPEEYSADCSLCDPAHPKGRLFVAEAGMGAFRFDPPEGGFTVTSAGPYTETQRPEGWLLTDIPAMKVDYGQAKIKTLTKYTTLDPEGSVQLGDFKPDRDSKLPDGEGMRGAMLHVLQPEHCERCLSAVSSALTAADGRAPLYVHGNGYAWDHSAVRLILKESGAAVAEYNVPGTAPGKEKSLLIAGRNLEVFRTAHDALQEMDLAGGNVLGDRVGQFNMPGKAAAAAR